MAFIDQVQDLTSLTVSDNDELSQFLKDGVIDVTNRWLLVRPQDIELFARESSEQTSNASLHLNGAKIVSVIREDGVTSNNWRPCRKISSAQQYLVTDTESLSFASKFNPAYMIGNNGQISVFPAPGADPNAFKVYYVNNDPEDKGGTNLIYSHSDIGYFPDDKVYLVVMYAGMKLLQANMGATTITDLSVTAVPPDVPTLSSITFSSLDSAIDSSLTAVAAGGTLGSATLPTYTKPTITTRVGFNSYWVIGDFPDSDPGAFSITAVPPDVPSLSSITFSSIDSDVDATLVAAATSTTLGGTTTPPAYTKPTATGGAGLTGMEAGVIADGTDQIEFDTWWDTLGDLIETQEDTELAGAQIQKISAYISAYQTEIQNELNEFNKENVAYQSSVQEAMAEFQSANQIAIGNAERSQNRQLQNSVQDAKVIQDNNAQLIQKFSTEIQEYQAEVGTQVQEYTQKLQRYSTELNTVYQAWAKTESDSLQQYQTDIQNELNEFNLENAKYQASMQEAMGEFQSQNQMNIANAERSQNRQLQNSINDMKVIFDTNSQLIQKFSAELQEYQAEVGAQVQEYTQNLQADGTGYQWLQDQYAKLKTEYDSAFMIAAPKPQPQQQARR